MVQRQLEDYVTYRISQFQRYDSFLSKFHLLSAVDTGRPDSERASMNLRMDDMGWASEQSMSRAREASVAVTTAVFSSEQETCRNFLGHEQRLCGRE